MERFIALVFLLFLSPPALASEGILISGFDPFDKARDNNSRTVGKEVVQRLKKSHPELEISYCQLRTVYDKSSQTLIDCARSMKEPPKFILSLGESGCGEVRVETMARNLDKDTSSDNDGIHRGGQEIIPGAPQRLGLSLPLHRAWCDLGRRYKKFATPSSNAGSFVCNNISYHLSHSFPDVRFGFIHVPRHDCLWRPKTNTEKAVVVVTKMVQSLLEKDFESFETQPVSKAQLDDKTKAGNSCEKNFYEQILNSF